jgi:hypothetical protein
MEVTDNRVVFNSRHDLTLPQPVPKWTSQPGVASKQRQR